MILAVVSFMFLYFCVSFMCIRRRKKVRWQDA